MDETDIIIIGAGVVGLAVGRELARCGRETIIVERHKTFGQETSSRNSEVIHGGMYYPADSLKARLCIQGRRMLYDLCAKHRIPCRQTGKLICAADRQEERDLDRIYRQGLANGVEGLSMLSGPQVKALEPFVQACAGLLSPQTGIIDSHSLMSFFLSDAKDAGALCAFNTAVTHIHPSAGRFVVRMSSGSETTDISCRCVINCAGLDSDIVAQMSGIDIEKAGYVLHYCRGEYFRVSGRASSKIRRLIYPVPKPKSAGLGVHATLDLAGGMRLGPDTKYLNSRRQDYTVDPSKLREFCNSAKKILPFIDESDLSPDTCGIRPKLQAEGGDFRDFVIRDESDKGLPGFINLVGIESPGLTASCAIAGYVKAQISKFS
ncbi:MAG: NAD(P)/FAD-dependent oxidoreductase [Candidatus Omnitrophota bacterium]